MTLDEARSHIGSDVLYCTATDEAPSSGCRLTSGATRCPRGDGRRPLLWAASTWRQR